MTTEANLTKEEDLVQKIRQERYGSTATVNHRNLGLLWTGIIQSYFEIELSHPIPSHVVLLMMSASKINRAASERGPLVDDDNYVDGKIYMELAKLAKKDNA